MPEKYPMERVESILSVYIASNNNQTQTARATGISQATLSNWVKSQHRDLYHEMQDAHDTEVELQIAAKLRQSALDAADVVGIGVTETRAQIESGEIKDVAKATRDMAWVVGNSVDKVMQLTGRAQKVVPGSGALEGMALVDALVTRGILKVTEPVDTTVVEALEEIEQ